VIEILTVEVLTLGCTTTTTTTTTVAARRPPLLLLAPVLGIA
jgi:hypothetical protein